MKIENYVSQLLFQKDGIKNTEVQQEKIQNDNLSIRHRELNIAIQSDTSSKISVERQIESLKAKIGDIHYNLNYDFSQHLLLDNVVISDKMKNLKESVLMDINREINKNSLVNPTTLSLLENKTKEILNEKS